jgi:uncharacterized YigZ family protein
MDYKTVKAPVRAEFIEKRSKFIASVSPCKTAEEATEFISRIKTEFYDARHNCFAYIIKDGAERFSDDGEPQGTAGMPILEVIRRRELKNVAVVVTRYFGGILLGAPGLVRAYNHTASIGLDSAKTVTMCLCDVLSLSVTYDFYARVELIVRDAGGRINKRDFAEKVNLQIYMPKSKTRNFNNLLREASAAAFEAKEDGEIFLEDFQ